MSSAKTASEIYAEYRSLEQWIDRAIDGMALWWHRAGQVQESIGQLGDQCERDRLTLCLDVLRSEANKLVPLAQHRLWFDDQVREMIQGQVQGQNIENLQIHQGPLKDLGEDNSNKSPKKVSTFISSGDSQETQNSGRIATDSGNKQQSTTNKNDQTNKVARKSSSSKTESAQRKSSTTTTTTKEQDRLDETSVKQKTMMDEDKVQTLEIQSSSPTDLTTHQLNSSLSIKNFTCSKCRESFPRLANLTRHLAQKHAKFKPYSRTDHQSYNVSFVAKSKLKGQA